ncbi:hypothetical protein NDU88_000803 [Pleurodeles waltl]|uniref:Uncharacterized protein n=1 Tax=Pleurodeles waltl TaxID=8319 RepID=A0AAV7WJ27_PLEWA|nr:hypothetical protein NDU88_000803 [Pleurodeles waltl]
MLRRSPLPEAGTPRPQQESLSGGSSTPLLVPAHAPDSGMSWDHPVALRAQGGQMEVVALAWLSQKPPYCCLIQQPACSIAELERILRSH